MTYEVSSNKVLVVEIAVCLRALSEDIEVLRQRNENAEEQRNVGSSKTEWSSVRHHVLGNALSATRANKPDVRNQKRDPRQQSENGGEVDEVAENHLRIIRGVHEGSAAEKRGNGQSRYGHTTLVGPEEDLGSMAFDSKTVDCTGGDVKIRVRSAEGEEQDASVDNGR